MEIAAIHFCSSQECTFIQEEEEGKVLLKVAGDCKFRPGWKRISLIGKTHFFPPFFPP